MGDSVAPASAVRPGRGSGPPRSAAPLKPRIGHNIGSQAPISIPCARAQSKSSSHGTRAGWHRAEHHGEMVQINVEVAVHCPACCSVKYAATSGAISSHPPARYLKTFTWIGHSIGLQAPTGQHTTAWSMKCKGRACQFIIFYLFLRRVGNRADKCARNVPKMM